MLVVNEAIKIPRRELGFDFVRSSGPGGQNVNKVNSKAVLRWAVVASPCLPEAVRARFLARWASRVTAGGELVLASDRYRDRARNVEDCLEKLRAMLLEAAAPPVPRRKTKPSRAAVERGRRFKRLHAAKKRLRGKPERE